MTDFSQYGEQAGIVEACGQVPGRLLDVGANDGVTFSMTRQLMLNGWSGVFVEPSPVAFLGLFNLYKTDPRATLVNAAVGGGWAVSELFYTEDVVSTLSREFFRKRSRTASYLGTFYVPVVPLRHLLDAFGPFDMVNIDVEGQSADLFPEALEHAPRVLVIEHDGFKEQMKQRAAGYRSVFENGTNLVLAKG